jgi:hypothetical protein
MINATPFLRLYAHTRNRQLKKRAVAEVQSEQLLRLTSHAKNTQFGREHGFSTIKSVSDYQSQVPLRTYEQFWSEYWKDSFPILSNKTWPGTIPYYAVSSGTSSGATKYIPYTTEMQRSNSKAGLDLLVHHLSNRPQSQIFAGKSFLLGGSSELIEQHPGIFSGDLSGIAVKTLPWWARKRYFPDQELALIKNWEEKIARLSKRSLEEDIRMMSGVPSWLMIYFDHLFEQLPESERLIKKIYPKLEMLVHGGVSFTPYRAQFEALLKGSHAELREVYPASEGFIASADRGFGDGLRLNLDHQIFFEFVPTEELSHKSPTRHWIQTVEQDVNYALVLSTCAGLWSYIIGDTVRFVDTKTPRVLVTGRTSYYLSAFGEHLIAEEIDQAIFHASSAIGMSVTDYSVGAVFPKSAGELGGHLYIVEFKEGLPTPSQLNDFCEKLDAQLCKRNEDYDAHRAQGFGLKMPSTRALPSGTFRNWMEKRGKLGGQNKVPRIIINQELFDDLIKFTD